jgi:hypothetical protein
MFAISQTELKLYLQSQPKMDPINDPKEKPLPYIQMFDGLSVSNIHPKWHIKHIKMLMLLSKSHSNNMLMDIQDKEKYFIPSL